MSLKSIDIVVLLKLVSLKDFSWSYRSLGKSLFINHATVFQSISRSIDCRLFNPNTKKPRKKALLELLIHGIKYVFPPVRGSIVRGIPTGYAAPPLNTEIVQAYEYPPVWPYDLGDTRGYSFLPLDECVPKAAGIDKELYELLSLVDAIRGGRSRESVLAQKMLSERMDGIIAARRTIDTIRNQEKTT